MKSKWTISPYTTISESFLGYLERSAKDRLAKLRVQEVETLALLAPMPVELQAAIHETREWLDHLTEARGELE